MGTESNQSSGNRNIPVSRKDSREEERQYTGLFRWDDPENLMPSWSVPPGLIIPGPRQPEAEHLELALVRDRLRRQQPHRRRLAGAVRPEQSDARAHRNVEVEVVHGRDRPVRRG